MLDRIAARDLLRRWDAQQDLYIAEREKRFSTMIAAVEAHCGPAPIVIDLACGPGSLGQRLRAALPSATIYAVDVDPVLQTIGRAAEVELDWIETDLRQRGWSAFLAGRQVDAVLSTTALHWLDPAQLVALYLELAGVIRAGGIFLDGDHRRLPPGQSRLQSLAAGLTERLLTEDGRNAEDWATWWRAVRAEPALAEACHRRDVIFATREPEHEMSVEFQLAGLREAGFAEAGTLWQIATDWIVAAIR